MVEGTENIRERHLSEYVIISCPHSFHTVEKELRVYDPKSCTKVKYLPTVFNTLVSETTLDPGMTLYLLVVSSLPSLLVTCTHRSDNALRVTLS